MRAIGADCHGVGNGNGNGTGWLVRMMGAMGMDRLWIQAVIGGACAGALVEVLNLRLNPDAVHGVGPLILGWLLWMAWGALVVGLPFLVLRLLVRFFFRDPITVSWRLPEILTGVYLVATVLSRVNADMLPQFLSGSGHRTLGQDAVAWLICSLLALGCGYWLNRKKKHPAWRLAYVAVFLLLPLVRLIEQPPVASDQQRLPAAPLGCPARPLVVIGIEGLDSRVLLTHGGGNRYPNLARFVSEGSWGSLSPYRPFLRQSLWTTTSTGAYPRRHGVMSRWAWHLPQPFPGPLCLLPWTPVGSRWLVPLGIARRREPPAASVPPMWDRVRASDVATTVLRWPGIWTETSAVRALPPSPEHEAFLDQGFRLSLEEALQPFAHDRDAVVASLSQDTRTFVAAREAIATGHTNVWFCLRGLAVVRRNLEPLHPRDLREREVLELALELLDHDLGRLLDAVDPDSLVAIVSPYGMEPPDSWERLWRLLGAGDTWHTSAESCPDGVIALLGQDVVAGRRLTNANISDVAPTLCYLIGLPLAQYMEGRVLLDAVQPRYVGSHPLRMVE